MKKINDTTKNIKYSKEKKGYIGKWNKVQRNSREEKKMFDMIVWFILFYDKSNPVGYLIPARCLGYIPMNRICVNIFFKNVLLLIFFLKCIAGNISFQNLLVVFIQ